MREAIGVDLYNQSVTGMVAKTLNAIKSDADHVPCVVLGIINDHTTPKIKEGDKEAYTLASRDYKGGAVVILAKEKADDISETKQDSEDRNQLTDGFSERME